MRILVVEDDRKLADLLRRGLTEEGLIVDVAHDAARGAALGLRTEYDVAVVDVLLPVETGFDLCRRLRAAGRWFPILMLTARDGVTDRVEGLDAGADDYLVKPFAFAELLARIRALARRTPTERPTVLAAGDLTLDPASRRVHRGTVEIELSPREFAVLEMLLRNAGQTLERDTLLEHCWDHAYESRSNVVDVYVRYLREKVDRPFGCAAIETVRGIGYRLRRDGG